MINPPVFVFLKADVVDLLRMVFSRSEELVLVINVVSD
jgi:hypothetical protein